MDKEPLVSEQIAAGEQLIREFADKISVCAAFWLREQDSDQWYLYLASDEIDDSKLDFAYGTVLQIIKPFQSLWLDPFQVKVLGTDSLVAKAAMDVMKKYPGNLATRYNGREFGGLSVDEVVIYPIPLPAAS